MINKIKNNNHLNTIKLCNNCALSRVRRKNTHPVVGRGAVPADILFIGEAPGTSEELLGIPFIGQSGKLLDKMLQKALNKSVSYYITNCVMCRPTDRIQGPNREPNPFEITKCSKNLMKVYRLVNPKIVVFVGRVSEKHYKNEFTETIFIYHPSFLLRGGGENHPNYLSELRKLSELSKYLEINNE